jgi:hypothetical protein
VADLVGKFCRLNPKPGDLITLSFEGRLSRDQVEQIRDQFVEVVPKGCKLLILEGGTTIEKVSLHDLLMGVTIG